MSQASDEEQMDRHFQVVDRRKNNKIRKPGTDIEEAVPRLEGLIRGALKNIRKAHTHLVKLHDHDRLTVEEARDIQNKLDNFRDTVLALQKDLGDVDITLTNQVRLLATAPTH